MCIRDRWRILLFCYFVSALYPPALLASLKYACSVCVMSSFFLALLMLSFIFILSFSCGYYAVSSVSVAAAIRFAYDIYVSWYVRTLIWPFFWSEVYDLFQLLCVLSYVFICFPPEVIFRFRVIGACPATMDCIVAMSSCENNNNNRCVSRPVKPTSQLSSLEVFPRKCLHDILPVFDFQVRKNLSCRLKRPSVGVLSYPTVFKIHRRSVSKQTITNKSSRWIDPLAMRWR